MVFIKESESPPGAPTENPKLLYEAKFPYLALAPTLMTPLQPAGDILVILTWELPAATTTGTLAVVAKVMADWR